MTEATTSTLEPRYKRIDKRAVEAKKLASLYSKPKRIQETASVCAGVALLAINGLLLLRNYRLIDLKSVAFASVTGILAADFLSGVVHWAADTWGSVDIPVFGKAFLRPFREHHLDPTAITRHDFVETNGDNFMLIVPKLAQQAYGQIWGSLATSSYMPWNAFWFFLAVYVAMTNMIHSWAHTYFGLPWAVEKLQKYWIILPKQNHREHHTAPHDCCYCITTGWLNYPLDAVGFWRGLEVVISKITGAEPRSDDLKWYKTD